MIDQIFCGVAGMFDVAHAVVAQRVHDGVDDRRRPADRADLAAALHAQRVVRAQRVLGADGDVRHVVGARHRVVHESSR